MIDAVTKSKLIFIFGKIKLKLKIFRYFPILQYFNVCFILLDLSQNANGVSDSLCHYYDWNFLVLWILNK